MKKTECNLLAVLRIRGEVGIRPEIKTSLNLMKLHRKNRVILVKNTHSNMGMIKKVKDYCTFGEINQETVEELLKNRGRLPGNNELTNTYLKKAIKMDMTSFSKSLIEGKSKISDVDGLKKFFKLHPPRGGFERMGIKKPYTVGGVLGYRGDKINLLIKKML